MDVETKIRDLIVEMLEVEESDVVPTARFREDLDADSLDLMELIMELESEFDQEISDEEAQQITTVGAAYEFVKARLLMESDA